MKLTNILMLCGVICSAQAATIISDNITGDGDNTAETGTITTAWAGFGFALNTSLHDVGVVNVNAGGFSGNFPTAHPNMATVTYDGTIMEGLYTLTVELTNPNNAGFLGLTSVTLGGAAFTESAGNTAPASGSSSNYEYTLNVASGSSLIGQNLDFIFSATTGGGNNMGLDQLDVDFTPVPEPTSSALIGLAGLALFTRRKR